MAPDLTLYLPELILLVGACVALVLGLSKEPRGGLVAPFSLTVVAAALVVAIIQGLPENGGSMPGLWLGAMGLYARWTALGVGLLIFLVNWHQPVIEERGEYHSMILFSLLGILLTASANDLIVLFFAVELVSVPTYVLIALSRPAHKAAESSVKYFFLGALAAALFAYGLSFLYGHAGTTELFHLGEGTATSAFTPTAGRPVGTFAIVGLMLVFCGLAFKLAAVPLHLYVADVYEGAAAPVAGLLGFVPKIAGLIALVKIFGAFHWELPTQLLWMVWIVAAATMTVGNALALWQRNIKRVLAYSSIAHTGYMLVALLVGPVAGGGPLRDGVAALLFYVAIYGAMNLGAFALIGAFRIGDREAEAFEDLAGLARRAPALSFGLAVCVFSLMGFPPTAGLLGKVYIFSSAFSLDSAHAFHTPLIVLAVIGVLNSAVGAAYYLRIVHAAYMGSGEAPLKPVGGVPIRVGVAFCALPMLLFFVVPWPVIRVSTWASEELGTSILLDPARVAVVLPAETSEPIEPVESLDGLIDGTNAPALPAEASFAQASEEDPASAIALFDDAAAPAERHVPVTPQ
jgi:NADH-quinone oxidoreductase subunit N